MYTYIHIYIYIYIYNDPYSFRTPAELFGGGWLSKPELKRVQRAYIDYILEP